jgi:hypothetical protein
MGQYTTVVQATSNSTINTEDLFLELKAAAATTIKIKRVRVGFSDGTATIGVDNHFRVRLYRYTTSTAGTTATPLVDRVSRNVNESAAAATAKGKSGATACVIGTTAITTSDVISVNGRALYEWLARDDDDMIETLVAGCFCVAIQSGVASQLFTVTVDHDE